VLGARPATICLVFLAEGFRRWTERGEG
jgi:hypothetical protein